MKQIQTTICLLVVLSLMFLLPGCSTNKTYTEEKTDKGMVITTQYFSVTLPPVWQDNYKIEYSQGENGYSLRFVDHISYEQQGHSGHIFTIGVHPAMGEELDGFFNGFSSYQGGLLIPDIGLLTVGTEHPTDVQYTDDRTEIYHAMTDTIAQVMASLTPTVEGGVYYSPTVETFETRAALTTHKETGKEVMDTFTKATGNTGEYVGIALDSLDFTISDDSSYASYGFHVYKGEESYYLIPFRENRTLPMVYEMTGAQYPKAEFIWDCKEETLAYDALLADMAKAEKEGYYHVRDLNRDGINELILKENTAITVYGYDYEKNATFLIETHDFITGTTRLLTSHRPAYPGIFVFTVGGGYNHYQYFSLQNNALQFEPLWDESISRDFEDRILSDNEDMIEESKTVYEENKDIEFSPIVA